MNMKINFLANKWILGGIIWISSFTALCLIWYKHSLTPYEKSAEDTYQIIHQEEITPDINSESMTGNITRRSAKLQKSNETIITNNKIVEPNSNVMNDENSKVKTENLENLNASSVGFGSYPNVPTDYPLRSPVWLRNPKGVPIGDPQPYEIMDRVLIKLWNQGRKDITGASYNTSDGKVYPHYANTAYVQYEKKIILPDGNVYQPIARVTGGPDIAPYVKLIRSGKTPPHIQLLDYDRAGIDPYKFLNM
ncbi:hypothetical protein C6497_08900 [Candidatus Poribacteria bacterium]|nr:MAG: hypothetical protein C6497_08900 [Candidatus Poribacteria bacterium]